MLEQVAQTGGSINGVTVVGDVAYVGMGPRLAAFDISKHGSSPRFIGQSQPLPGLVTQLLSLSPTVPDKLIVSAGKYLFEMDISDPGAMGSFFPIELPGTINAMVLDEANGTLYTAGMIYQSPYQYSGFIQSMRISADGVPVLLDLIDFPTPPISLASGVGSLFIGADGDKGGLYRIKLETPGKLSDPYQVIVSGADNNYFAPHGMQVIGDRLYAGVNMDLQAYDITNPNQPVQVWKEFIGFMPESFNVYGSKLNIFGWGAAGAYIPGYTSLTPPEPVVGSNTGVVSSITAAYRDDFLVAFHDFEVYSSTDLKLLGIYQPPVISILGVAANDRTVYVVDGGAFDGRDNATLRLFSLPDLEPLGEVPTEIPSSCCWFSGIAVEGDRVYLAATDGLWIYYVSKPVPALLAKPDIIKGQLRAITAIQLDEERLLFIAEERSELSIITAYDLTDLLKPAVIGNPLNLGEGRVYQMTWYNAALYSVLTSTQEGVSDSFYKIEFHNQQLDELISLQFPGSIFSMSANHGFIAVTGTEGMFLFKTTQSTSSGLISQTNLTEPGRWVAILNDQVMVVAGDDFGVAQLLVFDIQDPDHPRQAKAMEIAYSMGLMGSNPISEPYIVLAGGSSGVDVLEYQIQK